MQRIILIKAEAFIMYSEAPCAAITTPIVLLCAAGLIDD